ncbi:MAG: 3-hydroxyisobutyrate dehydrogenase [Thermoleophilaceae bacterium]|nr:3-hydroxyisobutyrate dehydrogenase [Thermoleophilaceae bacterium]
MSEELTVAVLGTGTMGAAMARNIASAGMTVRAWNRTRERAEGLGEVAGTPGEAVEGADVMLTMLPDGPAVEEVARQALDALRDDAVWLQMSTVGIEATERLARMAEERGVGFVDAPVSGTKQPAENGELVVLASGARDARERVKPIFEAVGSKVVELGDVGEGTRLKLVLNLWLVALVESLAETIAFAESVDIDPDTFLDAIRGGPLGPAYADLKGKAMIAREFPPAFKLKLARKDAGLVLEAAQRHDFEAWLTETVANVFDKAIEKGHGDDDMAAIFCAYK